MVTQEVSKTKLLDGAQMALSAIIAGTMSYLKQRNISIDDWVSYIGKQFEDSWLDLEGRGADEIMQHILALQVLPMGVEVTSEQMTPEKSEVQVTSLPDYKVLKKFGTTPEELLEGFDLSAKDFEKIYAIYEPSAKAIGLRFTHHLQDGHEVLRLE